LDLYCTLLFGKMGIGMKKYEYSLKKAKNIYKTSKYKWLIISVAVILAIILYIVKAYALITIVAAISYMSIWPFARINECRYNYVTINGYINYYMETRGKGSSKTMVKFEEIAGVSETEKELVVTGKFLYQGMHRDGTPNNCMYVKKVLEIPKVFEDFEEIACEIEARIL
jgi:hypothetical protein